MWHDSVALGSSAWPKSCFGSPQKRPVKIPIPKIFPAQRSSHQTFKFCPAHSSMPRACLAWAFRVDSFSSVAKARFVSGKSGFRKPRDSQRGPRSVFAGTGSASSDLRVDHYVPTVWGSRSGGVLGRLRNTRIAMTATKKTQHPPPVVTDIEDLLLKHPGVAFVQHDAPSARRDLLKWYDQHHRILPWRRNKFSKHCLPREKTDLSAVKGEEILGPEPQTLANPQTLATAALYWVDVETAGSPCDVPTDQYAYGVWVSEIMSQQTQIERVAVYWRRWMSKWPTADALSDATQEQVNELWAGLGYYRRARFLLEGAKFVVGKGGDAGKDSEGKDSKLSDGKQHPEKTLSPFPNTAKALSSVPGVGPYTAAAVASIAFHEPIAAVDGNVIRVATRLGSVVGGGDAVKNNTSASRAVREIANALLDETRPGDFNQAMMELGATVCTPRNPKCLTCPLRAYCQGFKMETSEELELKETLKRESTEPKGKADVTSKELTGEPKSSPFRVTDLPEKDKKAEKRLETVLTRVVEARVVFAAGAGIGKQSGGTNHSSTDTEILIGYLVTKRPEGGLLGGLWEFPSVVAPAETKNDLDRAKMAENLVSFCDPVSHGSPFGVDHLVKSAGTLVSFRPVEQMGEVTHVFSHVKQQTIVTRLAVEVTLVAGDDSAEAFFAQTGEGTNQTPWRWVRGDAIHDAGLTSGPMKVFGLLTKENGKKKNAAPKESAIGKMFAKKQKKAEEKQTG